MENSLTKNESIGMRMILISDIILEIIHLKSQTNECIQRKIEKSLALSLTHSYAHNGNCNSIP